MFITHPPFELRVPKGIAVPEARYWRMIEVNLHIPWFILAIRSVDPGSGLGFVRTYFFAWDQDLLDFLPSVDTASIRSLLCMVPGWKTKSACWTAHGVHELWVSYTDNGGRYPHLLDCNGREVDVGLSSDGSGKELKRVLAFELKK